MVHHSGKTIKTSLGIVITGGTAGLGYALASGFLLAGDRVVICGRDEQRLAEALLSLREAVPGGMIDGICCHVGEPSEGKKLADFAVSRLGQVDRWINNAGTAGELKRPLWELTPEDIAETCTTNLAGTILMCAEAVNVMQGQPSSAEPCYHIFNMGFSRAGAAFSRSAVPHKASKRAVAETTHFLYRELRAAGISTIGVHELSPGLVLTNLLLRDAPEEAKRLFAVIAEKPEKVASALVPRIRSISGHYSHVRYQPIAIMFIRMITGVVGHIIQAIKTQKRETPKSC